MPDPSTVLRLNGEALPCPAGLTLADLLAQQGIAALSIATAVNGDFVARAQRAERPLQPGDAVTTFQAIVGG